MGKLTVYGRWGLKHLNFVVILLHDNKIAHEASHWVVLYSDQVVLGCSSSSSCRNFCSKVSCFSLSATCQWSHRNAEVALEYLDCLDENEPLYGAGLISDDDDGTISLPSDGGLEISRTEGVSKAKSSDGKSLTARVTMAMIRCAFVVVHVEEEMFPEFWDMGVIEDVGNESVEQEGSLGEGLVEAEVEHKVKEEALVAETLLTGTQPTWAAMGYSTTHLGRCESWRVWTTRIYSTARAWCPFPMIF